MGLLESAKIRIYSFPRLAVAADLPPECNMGDDRQNRSELTRIVSPALSLIPYVGGALAAAWSDWDTATRFRRLEDVLRAICRQLESQPVNEQFAASAPGMSLLELTLRQSETEYCEKKRGRLANVLVCAWVSDAGTQYVFDESLLFLRAAATLGDPAIAMLNVLQLAGPSGAVPFADLTRVIAHPLESEAERRELAIIVLNSLCSEFAFVKRAWDLNRPDVQGTLIVSGNMGPEGIARSCFHAITLRGTRFVEFVLRGEEDNPPSMPS
ncbi:MAG TPA: hypothetical protein VHY91_09440 [Pirellulales bacterium]|nr:hypothetical protein [Pirellulales bacterium]